MSDRIAVLVSGAGTNLQALLDDPWVGPRIVLVVSSVPGAPALERARRAGVPASVVNPRDFETGSTHDEELAGLLEEHRVDHVALAGYMVILGPALVGRFRDRILNVHPSLLPSFPGAGAVRQALDWAATITGVTVHLVDEDVDHGPIVLQEAVPILPDDDVESLHSRIQGVEHRLYPRAVRLLAEGNLKVEGRRVRILQKETAL